ncbi:hypothetical protein RINTHM_14180 [Richelia intracellularis HM01]|nr:hypothetical protein RINTHM_14180 [Richelia intracellularis HM01]
MIKLNTILNNKVQVIILVEVVLTVRIKEGEKATHLKS